MNARILENIIQDFKKMSVDEYLQLHQQALERSKKIEETILFDSSQDLQELCAYSINLSPSCFKVNIDVLSTYNTFVNYSYLSYSSVIETSFNEADLWIKVA